MFRLFPAVAACAVLASASAQTIYKCQLDGKTSYGDLPCASGASVELAVPAAPAPDAHALARAARQHELATQTERREAARLEHAEREQQRAGRTAAAQRQKCARLRLRHQWALEDVRRAPDKAIEAAKIKLRRQTQSLAVECPA